MIQRLMAQSSTVESFALDPDEEQAAGALPV